MFGRTEILARVHPPNLGIPHIRSFLLIGTSLFLLNLDSDDTIDCHAISQFMDKSPLPTPTRSAAFDMPMTSSHLTLQLPQPEQTFGSTHSLAAANQLAADHEGIPPSLSFQDVTGKRCFQSRTRNSISHSIRRSVGPSVRRSVGISVGRSVPLFVFSIAYDWLRMTGYK